MTQECKSLAVRDWKESDMPYLAAFHDAMNVGYPLPEHFGPLFCIRKVIVDADDKPIAFATVKLVSEAFFWADPNAKKSTKAMGFAMLHSEIQRQATQLGLEETSCWIPKRIALWFSKTIQKLGWRQSPWPCWTYLLK